MTQTNPLIAQPQSGPQWFSGIGAIEGLDGLVQGLDSGNWIETGLGLAGTGLETAAAVWDPIGTLLRWAASWVMEHLEPLRKMLDKLGGNPPVIEAYAGTWTNVSQAMASTADDIESAVIRDLVSWEGDSATAYRTEVADKVTALREASKLCATSGRQASMVAMLVGAVRTMVRDAIAALVAWLVKTVGLTVLTGPFGMTEAVRTALTEINRVTSEVTETIAKLTRSLGNLKGMLPQLTQTFDEVIAKLKPKAPHSAEGAPPGTRPAAAKTPREPHARESTDPSKDGRPHDGKRTGGDPVDLATGEMLMSHTDVELPGVLALALRRTHISTYHLGRSFGPSWASTVDQRVELDAHGVCYVGADGVTLTYPTPPIDGTPVLPSHGARWPLRAVSANEFTVTSPIDGHIRHFGATVETGATTRVLLSAITDRNGNRITIVRDAIGTPTVIEHSGGYRLAVDVVDGRITGLRMMCATGGDIPLASYQYNSEGRLSAIGNSSGRTMRFEYDGDGRVTRWIDRKGHWYSYRYNHAGQVVATDGSGGALACSIQYDKGNRVTTYRNSLGAVSTYHFDDKWHLLREVDPLGATTRFEHDEYGRVIAETNPLGQTTRYEYGLTEEPTRIEYPDGSSSTTVQDEHGLPVAITDADGAQWRYRRDERGNIVEETDPMGAVTRYAYNELGHRRTETDALGNVHRIETDARGLPIAVINPLGHVTRIRRDQFGRVTATIDPLGSTTSATWTVEGNPLTRTRPDGTVERWRHDPEGNFVEYSIDDGPLLSVATTYFDLPVAQVNADGTRIEFGYDTELNLTTVTNAQGSVWRYEYDPAGFLVRETDFNGRVTTYERDAAGQLVGRTSGAGQTTTYRRDLRGSVVTTQSPTDTMNFAYDPAGRLVSASSHDSNVVLTRDTLGRVLTEMVNGRTVTSEYDVLGRCVRRRTPSGAVSTWEFDAAGSPIALRNGNRRLAFAYDAAGRETTRTTPSGLRLAQSWDANDRLVSQTVLAGHDDPNKPRQHRTFRYRPDGNVTAIADQINGSRRFELDRFGRITQVHGQRWSESYQYDVAGNLINAATHDAAPSAHWRYTGTLLHEAGTLRYQYDPQGRVVRKQRGAEAWQYVWNADDQLTDLVTPDGAAWRYRYDALGRRIAKERHARGQLVERIEFVWDGTTLAEQITTRHSVTWDYDPSSHRPLVQVERTGTGEDRRSTDEKFYAIVTDLVGAPTELLDEYGNVAWFAQTTAWGRPIAHGGGTTTPLRFPGQYADAESGLNYNYFRYYDPETARYFSADPVGLAGGYAPHSYVPNPLAWLDPLGLSLLDVSKNGVRVVVHEYDVDKPAHAHVTGRGREVRIGPNGHPIDGQPELSSQQKQVVENYKTEIRKAVNKLGKRNQAQEQEERARQAAKNAPCE